MTLASWNKSIERSKKARAKANQRRRDNQVRKEAGLQNYDPTATIPQWFINLYKTFDLKEITPKGAWREWCLKTLDNAGYDPRKIKQKVGRPRLPQHLKTEPIKVKRSDKMEQLLLDNNIHLTKGKQYDPVYLQEHPEWEFLPNGRVRNKENNIISVFKFLSDIATV